MKPYSWRVMSESDAGASQDSVTCALPTPAVKFVGALTDGTVEKFVTASTPPEPVVKDSSSLLAKSTMANRSAIDLS